MKYLCLVYFEPKMWDTITKTESEALDTASKAYDQELEKSGHMIVAEALQSVNKASTVRVRNGKSSITDGPFAETKEVLGGFILINAADMEEALQVASKIPLAKWGSVEVRPVLQF